VCSQPTTYPNSITSSMHQKVWTAACLQFYTAC
jgi:hypothetical protein